MISLPFGLTFTPNFNSLGGLGKDKSVACVSNVIVENISMQNTLSGVRIKTWQVRIYKYGNLLFKNKMNLV